MELKSETVRIMSGFEKRLEALILLELSACGHASKIEKANKQYTRLMGWMERQLESLQEASK